jgi:hypothetical protein
VTQRLLLLLLCQYGNWLLERESLPFKKVVTYCELHMVWVLHMVGM